MKYIYVLDNKSYLDLNKKKFIFNLYIKKVNYNKNFNLKLYYKHKKLIIIQNKTIYMFKHCNNSLLKLYKLFKNITNIPILFKKQILITIRNQFLINIDINTCSIKWIIKLDSNILNHIYNDNNILYVISKLSTIYAIHIHHGKILWFKKKYNHSKMILMPTYGPIISKIYLNNKIMKILSCPNANGNINFINAQSGQIIKTLNISYINIIFADIFNHQQYKNYNIISSSYNKGLLLISKNIIKIWKIYLKRINNILINDNFIFISTTNALININIKNGKFIWKKNINNIIRIVCINHKHHIFCITKQLKLIIINKNSGILEQKVDINLYQNNTIFYIYRNSMHMMRYDNNLNKYYILNTKMFL